MHALNLERRNILLCIKFDVIIRQQKYLQEVLDGVVVLLQLCLFQKLKQSQRLSLDRHGFTIFFSRLLHISFSHRKFYNIGKRTSVLILYVSFEYNELSCPLDTAVQP